MWRQVQENLTHEIIELQRQRQTLQKYRNYNFLILLELREFPLKPSRAFSLQAERR